MPDKAWQPLVSWARLGRNEFRDQLHWDIAAGSFELDADEIRRCAPGTRHSTIVPKFEAEIRIGRWRGIHDRRGPPADLHIECWSDHW